MTEYTDENTTAAEELWEKLSGDPGVVALPQDYVKSMQLPHAYRFPWDEDKGVYLLQGFHNLHCLVRVRLPHRHWSPSYHVTLRTSIHTALQAISLQTHSTDLLMAHG